MNDFQTKFRNELRNVERDYVPKYVLIGIWEVANSRRGSYGDPGWHLGIHLFSEISKACEYDLAVAAVEEIERRLNEDDAKGAIRILRLVLPGVMALVPSRRNRSFLSGIEVACEDGRLWN